MSFEIREYTPEMREIWEDMFIAYAHNELEDDLPDEIFRTKICPLFIRTTENGAGNIAIGFSDGNPAGFACYQVDSDKSDWCKRPNWGLIREFYIKPEYRRVGYGKALAKYAVNELLKKTDRLYLTAHSESAVRFWTACGYHPTGEVNKNGTFTMEMHVENNIAK